MKSSESDFLFCTDTFVEVLHVLKQRDYHFLTFSDVLENNPRMKKTCLLRHDVDVSMDLALQMAHVEHEQGVRSTYFVMLRSPMYNILSRHGSAALAELTALGHEIGLHFDAGCQPSPGKSMSDELVFELGILEELAGCAVKAFSFHQPTDEIINLCLRLPGLINTYNHDQLAGYKYISDSNRLWRDQNPFQLITSGVDHLHILLHPIWWMCPDKDVKSCWDRAIKMNFAASQAQLISTERAYGPAREIILVR